MRENRTYGLEGGETGLTGLPYPYQQVAVGEQALCCERISAATSQLRFSLGHFPIGHSGTTHPQNSCVLPLRTFANSASLR